MLPGAACGNRPTFRFYPLYDRMCREDILMSRSPAAPGVDGVSFGQIEELGIEVGGRGRRAGLREELVSKTH
jgi:hypothetical protein